MKVVYLTGAPAAGKTTALNGLLGLMPEIAVWKYSERLTRHLQRRAMRKIGHAELRSASSAIVGPEDIEAVDDELTRFVAENRGVSHVVIDSHPVTKEDYGFRCTPFSLDHLRRVGLDEIWVLYVDVDTTLRRLGADRQGRMAVSKEEAAMHSSLQASLAIQYGFLAGCPVYFFDASVAPSGIAERMHKRLNK